jgi:hypothetical protein
LWQDEGMRLVGLCLGLCALGPLLGCLEGARALGSGPAGATAADDFTVALATRFGPIKRGPRFDAARPKLARAALVPSRVFDEPNLWTASEGDWRQLDYFGFRQGEVYKLDVRPSAPPPRSPGDYRGQLRLQRIGDGRYEWTMRQELAVGSLRPGDASRALTAMLRSLEGVTPEEARERALEAFPRAARTFSRLYRLETLSLHGDPDGATAVHLGVRMMPETLRPTAPRYAAYLEKVAAPMEARARLYDSSGATWWRVELDELLWTFHLRIRDGSLVPLEGAPTRRLPDTVQLGIDFSTKAGPFTIGVRQLIADVTLTRTADEKGYTARYTHPPAWRLPFFIKPFLRGPLGYPFEGPGSSSSFAMRRSADGPTELARDYDIRVRESWIFKWMGGLGGSAVSDFRKGAESESDRYSRECLYALRDDVVTLLNEQAQNLTLARAQEGSPAGTPGPPGA